MAVLLVFSLLGWVLVIVTASERSRLTPFFEPIKCVATGTEATPLKTEPSTLKPTAGMTPEETQQFQVAVAASTYFSTTARSSRECDNTNQLSFVSRSIKEEDLLWKKDDGKGGYELVNIGKAFMPEWELKKEAKGTRVDVISFRFNAIQAQGLRAASPVPLYYYVDVSADISVTLLGTSVTEVSSTKRWCGMEIDFNTMKSGKSGCADVFADVKVPSINEPKDPVSYINLPQDKIEASERARDGLMFSFLVLGLLIALGTLITSVVLMRQWKFTELCWPCKRTPCVEERSTILAEEPNPIKEGNGNKLAAQENREKVASEERVVSAEDVEAGSIRDKDNESLQSPDYN